MGKKKKKKNNSVQPMKLSSESKARIEQANKMMKDKATGAIQQLFGYQESKKFDQKKKELAQDAVKSLFGNKQDREYLPEQQATAKSAVQQLFGNQQAKEYDQQKKEQAKSALQQLFGNQQAQLYGKPTLFTMMNYKKAEGYNPEKTQQQTEPEQSKKSGQSQGFVDRLLGGAQKGTVSGKTVTAPTVKATGKTQPLGAKQPSGTADYAGTMMNRGQTGQKTPGIQLPGTGNLQMKGPAWTTGGSADYASALLNRNRGTGSNISGVQLPGTESLQMKGATAGTNQGSTDYVRKLMGMISGVQTPQTPENKIKTVQAEGIRGPQQVTQPAEVNATQQAQKNKINNRQWEVSNEKANITMPEMQNAIRGTGTEQKKNLNATGNIFGNDLIQNQKDKEQKEYENYQKLLKMYKEYPAKRMKAAKDNLSLNNLLPQETLEWMKNNLPEAKITAWKKREPERSNNKEYGNWYMEGVRLNQIGTNTEDKYMLRSTDDLTNSIPTLEMQIREAQRLMEHPEEEPIMPIMPTPGEGNIAQNQASGMYEDFKAKAEEYQQKHPRWEYLYNGGWLSELNDQLEATQAELQRRKDTDLIALENNIDGTYDTKYLPVEVRVKYQDKETMKTLRDTPMSDADLVYIYANHGYPAGVREDIETEYGPAFLMPDDAVNEFNIRYKAKDYDGAMEVYESWRPFLEEMRDGIRQENAKENARGELEWVNALFNVPKNAFSGIFQTANALKSLVTGKGPNKNSNAYKLGLETSAERQEYIEQAGDYFAEKYGEENRKWGEFALSTSFSILDNVYLMKIGKVGTKNWTPEEIKAQCLEFTLEMMFCEATGNVFTSQVLKGRDPLEASVMALGSGAIEVLTERHTLENYLNITSAASLKNLVKSIVAEGSEEFAAEILDTQLDIACSFVWNHKNEIEQKYDSYYQQFVSAGMDPTEAGKKASDATFNDFAEQLGMATLGGAVSAVPLFGFGAASAKVNDYRTGSYIMDSRFANGNLEAMINYTQNQDLGPGAKKLASKISNDLQQGKTPRRGQVGKLAQLMIENGSVAEGKIYAETYQDWIRAQLEKLGIDQTEAKEQAEIITKAVLNDTSALTRAERNKLLKNQTAAEFMLEATAETAAENKFLQNANETAEKKSVGPSNAVTAAHMAIQGQDVQGAALKAGIRANTEAIQNEVKRIRTESKKILTTDEQINDAVASGAVRTGTNAEVLVDDQFGDIDGFSIEETNENGKSNQELKVKVNINGKVEEVYASDVRTTNPEVAKLMTMARERGAMWGADYLGDAVRTAKNMGENINQRFAEEAGRIKTAAVLGLEMPSNITMDQKAAAQLYTLAQKEQQAADTAAAKNKATLTENAKKTGKVTIDGETVEISDIANKLKGKGLVRNEVEILKAINDVLGMDIDIVRKINEGEFGEINVQTGKITLAYDEQYGRISDVARSVLNTLPHELTHWMRAASEEGFNSLKKVAINGLLQKGLDVQKMMLDQYDSYAEQGIYQSMDQVMEDVVAKSMEQMLISNEFKNRMQQELDKSTFAKVKNYIRNFIQKLDKVIARVVSTSSYESRQLGNLREQLAKTWMDERERILTSQPVQEALEEYKNVSTEQVHQEMEQAGEATPAAVKNSLAGRNAQGIWGQDVARAIAMDKQGVDADTILEETGCIPGFERNGKRQWWKVIDNDKAEINIPDLSKYTHYTLGDILQFDELYEAYPLLKRTPVNFVDNMDAMGKTNGQKIDIARQYVENNKKLDAKEWLSGTILHEIQHIIQEWEGSYRGTSTAEMVTNDKIGRLQVKNAEDTISLLAKKYGFDKAAIDFIEFDKNGNIEEDSILYDADKILNMDAMDQYLMQQAFETKDRWAKLLNYGPYSNYQNTVGEREAEAARRTGSEQYSPIDYGRGIVAEDYVRDQIAAAETAFKSDGYTSEQVQQAAETVLKAAENPVQRFSVKQNDNSVQIQVRDDGMMAIHNLGESSLQRVLEMGGFPMPSIAVVSDKQGWMGYGDISVFFGENAVNIAEGSVYNGDAYTPTMGNQRVRTAEQALEYLRSRPARGARGGVYSMNSLFADYKKIASMDEARTKAYQDQSDRYAIKTKASELEKSIWEDMNQIFKGKFDMDVFVPELVNTVGIGMLTAAEEMAGKNNLTTEEKYRILQDNIHDSFVEGQAVQWFNEDELTNEIMDKMLDYIDVASQMASGSGMMEAKPNTILNFQDDLKAIMIPEDTPKQIIQDMLKAGIDREKILLFPNNYADRQAAMKKVPEIMPGVRFSLNENANNRTNRMVSANEVMLKQVRQMRTSEELTVDEVINLIGKKNITPAFNQWLHNTFEKGNNQKVSKKLIEKFIGIDNKRIKEGAKNLIDNWKKMSEDGVKIYEKTITEDKAPADSKRLTRNEMAEKLFGTEDGKTKSYTDYHIDDTDTTVRFTRDTIGETISWNMEAGNPRYVVEQVILNSPELIKNAKYIGSHINYANTSGNVHYFVSNVKFGNTRDSVLYGVHDSTEKSQEYSEKAYIAEIMLIKKKASSTPGLPDSKYAEGTNSRALRQLSPSENSIEEVLENVNADRLRFFNKDALKNKTVQYSLKQRQQMFEQLNIDPTVYFTGTMDQIDAAEKSEEKRIQEFKDLIEQNKFMALEFMLPDGRTKILHHSTRAGIEWQLTDIGSDGVPQGHENFGLTGEKRTDEYAVHTMDELYRELLSYNINGAMNFNIMEDDNADTVNSAVKNAMKNPVKRFSMKNKVEATTGGLIAMHNLTLRNLMDTIREGAITAPSIAIVKAAEGHSKFGEISAIMKKSAIDPKQSTKNKIYGTDAWTPTRGNAQIHTELNYDKMRGVRDTLDNLLKNGDDMMYQREADNWINQYLYEEYTSETLEDMASHAYSNDGMIAAYKKSKGENIEKQYREVKKHENMQKEYEPEYNAFLDNLKDAGMLDEFMADMEEKPVDTLIDKYIDIFEQSGEKFDKVAKLYKKNPSSPINIRRVANRLEAANYYEEDGRQILTEKEFNKMDTIDAIRSTMDKKDFNNWVMGLMQDAIGRRGVRNNLDPFDRVGNRRTFRATHMDPTVQNIVKAMYLNHEEKGGEAGGATGLMAKASKEYKNLQEVRDDAGRLQTMPEEEYSKLVEQLDAEIKDYTDEIAKANNLSYTGYIKEALITAGGEYAKNQSIQAIKRTFLKEAGITLTDEQANAAKDLMDKAREIPTGYFEAKPARVVDFDEVAKIVAPDSLTSEQIKAIEDAGFEVVTYDGTEADRTRVVNEIADDDVRFSRRSPDADVNAWMERMQPWQLRTEAERQLLQDYKDLRMKIKVQNRKISDYNDRLKELQQKDNPTDADKKMIQNLNVRIANAQTVKDELEQKLIDVTGDEGYAKMMMQQSQFVSDRLEGKTAEEVAEAVARMEETAGTMEERITKAVEDLKGIAESEGIKRIRALMNTNNLDKAAADIRKQYKSDINKQELMDTIAKIRLEVEQGDSDRVMADIEALAGQVLESAKGESEYLGMLRGMTITLSPSQLKEWTGSNRSIKDLRSELAGTGIKVKSASLNDIKSGAATALSQSWDELCDLIPALNRDTVAEEQVFELLNFIQQEQRNARTSQYSGQMADVMSDLLDKVMNVRMNQAADPAMQRQLNQLHQYVQQLAQQAMASADAMEQMRNMMQDVIKTGKKAAAWTDAMRQDVASTIEYFDRTATLAQDTARNEHLRQVIANLKSEAAQKLLKNNQEWRDLMERERQARIQAEDNDATKRKMETVVKRVNKLLTAPKGLKNIPEHMQGLARELIETIVDNDISGGRRITTINKKALLEMKRKLDAWKMRDGAFNPADLNYAEDSVQVWKVEDDLKTIREAITEYNGRYNGKNILENAKMKGATLTRMQEAVSELYNFIKSEQSVNILEHQISIEDLAEKIREQIGGKIKKEWTGKLGGAINSMNKGIVLGNMTPEYVFRMIDNEGLTDLWKDRKAQENRNGLEMKKAQERLEEIAKKHNYDSYDMNEKHKVQLANGKTVTLTTGQLMSLYATWNREQTLGPEMSQHLKYGGFFAEQDTRDGIIGKLIEQKRANRVTGADMATIRRILTDEQKALVDEVVSFMSNDMSKLGNEASMKAFGMKIYKESYYFPFKMWDGIKSRKTNEAGKAAQNQAFHPSFSKSRLHGANNALIIGDFMETATDHIIGMINYATMGLSNDNYNKVLNATMTEVDQNGEETKRNVRTLVEEAYGKNVANYLEELKKQLEGGTVKANKDIYDKLISLFRKNAVAGSLSVALQQPLSYLRANVVMSPKYLTMALAREYWKGSYQEMLKHSGVAVIKEMGKFDMNAGASAREYITPNGYRSTGRKIWDFATDKLTILPEKMDAWTWTRMWVATKLEQKALHPEMDVKSDKFLDMVAERFNDMMRRTQVYDSVMVRSANMRSDSKFMKNMTSFMAEPTLTLNMLADAVRQVKAKKPGAIKTMAATGAATILSAVMQAAVKGAAGAGRNPDDDKTALENFLYRFGNSAISEMDPLTMIPGYSDLITLLKEGELADDAMGSVGKMLKAAKSIPDVAKNLITGDSSKGIYRDIEDSVAQLTQLFTNLPFKNLMRDARMMYNWVIDQQFAERANSAAVIKYQAIDSLANADNLAGVINKYLVEAGEGGYDTKNAAYYDRIHAAKTGGDEEKAGDMIEYLLKGKGVREKTLNSELAKRARADEDLTNMEKAEMVGEYGGKTSDYIKAAAEEGEISTAEAVDMLGDVIKDPSEYVKDQLRGGQISAEEARTLLKEQQPDKDDDSIWWTVDRIEYQKETGNSAGSGTYYRLKDAINNNSSDEIRSAVENMTTHGMTEKQIKDWIGKKDTGFKTRYLELPNGPEKVALKNALIMAYKAIGLTAEDANKIINKWK